MSVNSWTPFVMINYESAFEVSEKFELVVQEGKVSKHYWKTVITLLI